MDPVSGSLMLQAASAGAGAFSALGAAKAEKQKAEINSYIGRTRAMETDTVARQGLSAELGSIRSVMGANQQRPGVGTFEVLQELRGVRNRERRIQFGNEMQRSRDFAQQGRNAMSQGRAKFLLGAMKAGPSLFDLYQYRAGGTDG